MGGRVFVRMGDIFEGGTDLAVIPCSAKETISSAAARWKEAFSVFTPKDMNLKINLGSISPIFKFPGPEHIGRYYCYAASVLNDQSSVDVIESIGQQIAAATSSHEDIRIVEAPLLGTGAGGLKSETAAKALCKGFSALSHSEATLFMFVYDKERFEKLSTTLSQSLWGRAWAAIEVKPRIFGLSVDVKQLFRRK